MATPHQLRSYGRIGLLATTLVLAAALVFGAWSNYVGAREAMGTLYRGQADIVKAALRGAFHPWDAEPDSAALRAFVDSFPQFGVTYLAVVDSRGSVLASVGEPAAPVDIPAVSTRRGPDSELITVGDRVRLVSSLIIARRFVDHDPRERSGPSRLREGFANPPSAAEIESEVERSVGASMLYNVVDFEPVVAATLQSRASTSLMLAILSASILTLAALLFWRTSERFAAARVRMEEQRRLSVLGEMSAVMAHEIRNPLASLKGTAQLLAEKLPPGSRELQRAERIVGEAIRLETLTTDLLDFARSGPVQLEEVDPLELLRSSAAEVDGAHFEIDASGAPPRWQIDTRRMRHALVNILQNATQAVPAAGPPRVCIATDQRRLLFEIRDLGPGLPRDGEQRVFDPFFTTRTNGTGLGLAVAQRVVEMHGGSVTAANHPEGGAVFRILLPAPTG